MLRQEQVTFIDHSWEILSHESRVALSEKKKIYAEHPITNILYHYGVLPSHQKESVGTGDPRWLCSLSFCNF